MAYIHQLPTFTERADRAERKQLRELTNDIMATANNLGADYVYVAKNKSGKYYPMTFAFYAEGGKFIARRTIRTILLNR